ncbi:MAG: UDP-N-acetylmuramoyl-L-alanine--D-glutamate ligase [Alphaproteobacteria bacterium]|nr:UDP-N-acetylmuramoyl-L-alanine--D-glutamate ligase [Alphaproteobacteria bacterium]
MIEVTAYRDRAVMVLGLGRSGLAAAAALREGGAAIVTWDDDPKARGRAKQEGFPVTDPTVLDWSHVDALIPSPGIPLDHPEPHPAVVKARAARCEILGDIELLTRTQNEARYVGITGTNGKSTTTALIGHLLQQDGRRIEVGGNLGAPVLSLAPLGREGTYVLELSSFQIDLMQSPCLDVAVLLNITPDHLDRHGGLEGYVAAKRRLFDLLREKATAVIGMDDAHCRTIRKSLASGVTVVEVSARQALDRGVSAAEGTLVERLGETVPAIDLARLPAFQGEHNWQNAAAAWAAARAAGLKPEHAARSLASFVNLPHRQELVAVVNDVRYVNDSKATNATATATALQAFDAIYWIAGGRAKADGIAPLAPHFPRLRHAFLIGEAMEAFAATLDGKVAYSRCGDLETALKAAHAMAQAAGERAAVVLLSPACASYDQWKNFEERGDAFRSLVLKLPDAKPVTQMEGAVS